MSCLCFRYLDCNLMFTEVLFSGCYCSNVNAERDCYRSLQEVCPSFTHCEWTGTLPLCTIYCCLMQIYRDDFFRKLYLMFSFGSFIPHQHSIQLALYIIYYRFI